MNHVEVVKDLGKVKKIEDALRENLGDLYGDIWRVGIDSALRTSDLLAITFESISGDTLTLTEKITGKTKKIKLNQATLDTIANRRIANPGHKYLFQSDSNRSRALNKPVSRVAVANALKAIGERNSINMKLGTNSMRKTSCYHLLKSGQSLEHVANKVGHSRHSIAMYYSALHNIKLISSD